MSKQTRYLLTVDSATGAAVKLERLGDAGDLTEVPLSTLAVAIPGAQPMAGAGAPPASQPLVINIYMGGPQQAAPLSVSVPGLAGPGAPGGPGTYATLAGPSAPGQVSLFSVAEARAASAQPQGPGSTTTAAVQGPGAPGGPGSLASSIQGPGAPGGLASSIQGPGAPGGTPGGGEGGSQ